MTKPDGEPKQDPPKDDKVTAGTLRDFIREEIVKLLPGKKEDAPSTGDSGGTDIKSQVAAALEHLKSKEKRDARDKAVDDMLEKYNKPPEETAPVERRRVEKWMRWGTDADK